ncbi:MAG: hypothetical protein RLZZ347_144 [Candidatus Parcubacteria bacterium]|jgi:hypothetical protein
MKNQFVGSVFWMLNRLLAFCYRLIKQRSFFEVSFDWHKYKIIYSDNPHQLLNESGLQFARLYVHTVPQEKLYLLMNLPGQASFGTGDSLNKLRECAWRRSLEFPIRSLGSIHDSAKDHLVVWLKWQGTFLGCNRKGLDDMHLATTRLQEFLDENIAPRFMLQELIEVMISERVPQFLMAVLIKDCLERLRQHPLDSVCPDDQLTKLLEFLADNTWDGFDELRRECVLIAHAREAILEQVSHVEKLLAAASKANPYKQLHLERMLMGVGVPVPTNKP